jgi:hypothetical protein
MGRAVLLVLGVLALAVAAPARASHVARPPAPSPMPVIVHAPCPEDPEAGGCYYPPTNPTYQHRLYFAGDRFAFQHELGHAFDAVEIDAGERARFARLAGRAGAPWAASSAQDREGLAETFADAYALCRLGYSGRARWQTSTSYTATPRRHRRVCAFIAHAAG